MEIWGPRGVLLPRLHHAFPKWLYNFFLPQHIRALAAANTLSTLGIILHFYQSCGYVMVSYYDFNLLCPHYWWSWASFHVCWPGRIPFVKWVFKYFINFSIVFFLFIIEFLIYSKWVTCLCVINIIFNFMVSFQSLQQYRWKTEPSEWSFKNVNDILTLLCLKFINGFPLHLEQNANS